MGNDMGKMGRIIYALGNYYRGETNQLSNKMYFF